MLIEGLEVYLATLEDSYEKTLAAYQRHEINKQLPVGMDEYVQVDMKYNYLRIQNEKTANTDEEAMYYFIDAVRVANTNTVVLTLTMDLINSLGQGATAAGNPKNFTDKTQIVRQHGDRFYKPAGYSALSTTELLRKIDKFSEGDNVALYCKSKANIEANDPIKNWYVLYKTRNALDPTDISNPVDIFIIPDSTTQAITGDGSEVSYTASDLASGKYYYFLLTQNIDGVIQFGSSGYQLGTTRSVFFEGQFLWDTGALQYVYFYKSNNRIKYGFCIKKNATTYVFGDTIGDVKKVTIIEGTTVLTLGSKQNTSNQATIIANAEATTTISASSVLDTISSVDLIDRTDSQNMKLILFPYCPLDYSYDSINGAYVFGDNVLISGGLIKLTNFTGSFKKDDNNTNIELDLSGDLIFNIQSQPTLSDDEEDYRNAESKLYSSEYYIVKLLYDSFSSEIKLDRLTYKENLTLYEQLTKAAIVFKASNTMSGNFGFKWELAKKSNGTMDATYNDTNDYGNLLLVTRNNELSLYNNDYVNYIRTGYNYDKKAQALGAISGILSVGMQGATALATQNPFGLISAGASATQLGLNLAEQANNMQSRLAQLSSQATKVNGSNDVDLMQWYCENKLQVVKYSPDSAITLDIYKKLLYNGYSHSVIEKPNVTSRVWYNYLQCTPAFSKEGLTHDQRDWLDELATLYEQGVTVYHSNEVEQGVPSWDLTRERENWETWILEE